ncbi:hypothetical protein [Synechococcus sp. MU1617]|uniref:hypothetical protein n=1 Tax=Synechococcus sp. MU1617 TaxID=2508346 RepID=UPI001CF8F3E0|nr:hypothetical protein [Synechococcus sp. MU1617]MCB4389500.1 class I SAM-dependent methyltransferase [Synechococcus sp. MU1617]
MPSLHQLIEESFTSSSRKTGKYDSYYLSYASALEKFLTEKKETGEPIKLLEIGVMDGGSLEAWKKILGSNSKVYGLDLNPECKRLSCDDYSVFIGDQSDPRVWQNLINNCGQFDIIIDDGSHIGFSQAKTIDFALNGAIGDEGIVIIEDTHTAYIDHFLGDGTGVNFFDKVNDIIERINSRSIRLLNDPSSRLSYIKDNDTVRTSVENLIIFESIVSLKIKRGITNSSKAGSKGNKLASQTISKDVRADSKIYL